MFLALALVMSAPDVATTVSPSSSDETGKCVIGKALVYSKGPELAEVLAQVIASKCAELLPQKSDRDCGDLQARCDAIVQETNAQQRDLMARFAYRAVVMFRQNQ